MLDDGRWWVLGGRDDFVGLATTDIREDGVFVDGWSFFCKSFYF